MKRTIFLFFLFFCTHSFAQKVAIKNNLAYDALKTPNLSLEFSMGRKWTLVRGEKRSVSICGRSENE